MIPYVTANISTSQRFLTAQLRTGILPLTLEVGRFKNVQEENRLCELCELGENVSKAWGKISRMFICLVLFVLHVFLLFSGLFVPFSDNGVFCKPIWAGHIICSSHNNKMNDFFLCMYMYVLYNTINNSNKMKFIGDGKEKKQWCWTSSINTYLSHVTKYLVTILRYSSCYITLPLRYSLWRQKLLKYKYLITLVTSYFAGCILLEPQWEQVLATHYF